MACQHPEAGLRNSQGIDDEYTTICTNCGASSDGGPWVLTDGCVETHSRVPMSDCQACFDGKCGKCPSCSEADKPWLNDWMASQKEAGVKRDG